MKAILSGTNQVTRIDVNFGDNSPVWRADNSTLQLYIPDGRTSITEALADYGPDRHVDLIAQVAKQEAGFRQDITETFRPISVGKINPTPVLVAKRN